jgi:hypothetical protein
MRSNKHHQHIAPAVQVLGYIRFTLQCGVNLGNKL